MVRPGAEAVWLWLGAAGLLAGATAVVAVGIRRDAGPARPFHWLVAGAAGVSGLAYLAMALGAGATTVAPAGADTTVYWARYVGWGLAGPALLAALWLLADAGRRTLAALVGLAVVGVALGAAAALATDPVAGLGVERTRLALWGAAAVVLLALLGVIVRVLSPRAGRQPRAVAVRFSVLRNLLVVVALGYPVVWLVGPLGLGLVEEFLAAAGFLVLDLAAVLGFGGLLLRDGATLVEAREGRRSAG